MSFSGTSDEHLSLLEHLAPAQSKLSAVIVTTPQAVALLDAIKCLSFTRAVKLPVLGLIENMSGYVCPCCGEISNIFSTKGGEEMARREGLTFLGALPVDTELVTLLDAAEPSGTDGAIDLEASEILKKYGETSSAKLFKSIAERVVADIGNAEGGSAVSSV